MLGSKTTLSLFVLIAVLAVAGAILILRSSPSSTQQIQNKQQPTNQQHGTKPLVDEGNQKHSDKGADEQKDKNGYIGNIFELVKTYDKEIVALSTVFIAVFTVILAFATGFLWSATRDLVNETQLHGERALRAYVFVQAGQVAVANQNTAILADITVKNFGQTPAYRVRSWVKIKVNPPEALPWDDIAIPTTESPMGPGGDFHMQPAINVTPAELLGIRNRTLQIFVWGKIEYIDAFNHATSVTYRAVNGNEAAGPNWVGWHLNAAN